MLRRCEPLYDGDKSEVCGAWFDDARRMAVCPHVSLDGGDTVGVPGDPDYLVAKGLRVLDGSDTPVADWEAAGRPGLPPLPPRRARTEPDVRALNAALAASVAHRGVVGTVVYLLRVHAPSNAVAVLHQAAEQLRPPVDPDQRSYAERLRERLGMVPRPATPDRPRCTCRPTRVAGMGGLFRDPSCPTHGSPPSGLSRLRTDG